jgi:hypothetical protein
MITGGRWTGSNSLTFRSAYAGITKEFSVSQLEEVFVSLPASVWVDGKSIGVQQVGMASEPDHRTMAEITEKVKHSSPARVTGFTVCRHKYPVSGNATALELGTAIVELQSFRSS